MSSITSTSSSITSELDAMTAKTTPLSTSSSSSSSLSGALEMMKDRASIAKSQLGPQLQNMKDMTSKRFEKYQPSLDRVKSSASAAATLGRERMQPALNRVKEGSTQGWSILKTKLASAAPVAEKFQNMGLHVLGESALQVVVIENPRVESCRFLEAYKNPVSSSPSKMPRMLLALNRSTSGNTQQPETDDKSLSLAEKCLAKPYVLGQILLFCGSIQDLATMSFVNHACRSFIRSERRVWRFCVRYGDMPESIRFRFWEHVAQVDKVRESSELDFETYLQMAHSKGECTELILTDVRRTYGRVAPHKRALGGSKEVVVDTEQELINQLSDILHALAGRFPDVGYCQGMDYIAAHILDHVKKSSEAREASRLAKKAAQSGMASPPTSPTRTSSQAATRAEVETAFWILVALFENYGLRQSFGPGLQRLQLHCFQCQRLFELAFPALSDHFETEKVMLEMFVVGWFQTLYLYLNVLPRETLDRIWDIFLFENNWKIVLRVSLALLQLAEPHIQGKPIEDVMQVLNTFTDKADELLAPEPLLTKALSIKVTNSMLQKLAKQHTRHKKSLGR
ncbi:hypothetical protein Poli38472_009471 [Pythium oligandrum]|uniref:Rab-GAP TBC domain-containing protein n=1 Tax=Pythium oligandrum TaxID=41045 RepID=A0A8K1FKR6_PYTOL|nr:hypothetical protein Poli38472_009471 [Pythium oligandrum]|eukprot:TMW61978.1 hypothetical protein Poli38472_009471 [Pythium oligandrum]